MNLAATTLPKFNEPQKDTKFTKEANPDRLPFVALGDLSGFMFASRPQYAWLYNPARILEAGLIWTVARSCHIPAGCCWPQD